MLQKGAETDLATLFWTGWVWAPKPLNRQKDLAVGSQSVWFYIFRSGEVQDEPDSRMRGWIDNPSHPGRFLGSRYMLRSCIDQTRSLDVRPRARAIGSATRPHSVNPYPSKSDSKELGVSLLKPVLDMHSNKGMGWQQSHSEETRKLWLQNTCSTALCKTLDLTLLLDEDGP